MFAVKLDKPTTSSARPRCVRLSGRAAAQEAGRRSCSTDPTPTLWGGEALLIDGEPVGEITSAGWSDAAGRCVGSRLRSRRGRGPRPRRCLRSRSISGASRGGVGVGLLEPWQQRAAAATLDWFHAGVDRTFAPHRPRPDARPRRSDRRPPARRLGRPGHQDRDAGGHGRRRRRRRPARGQRLPERAPQQARHDAEPEVGRRRRDPEEAGRARRRAGRELPPRRQAQARHRLRDDGARSTRA